MRALLKEQKGYTLVELMVVLTIIAILAGTSTPVFTGYVKKAKSSGYLAQCRTVYMAAESCLSSVSGTDLDVLDLTALEEEIRLLTTLDVEVVDHKRKSIDQPFGVVITGSDYEKWHCKEILCTIGPALWVFDPDHGEFSEQK